MFISRPERILAVQFLAHLDLVSDRAYSDEAAAVFYLAKFALTSTLFVSKDVVTKLSTNLSSGFHVSFLRG